MECIYNLDVQDRTYEIWQCLPYVKEIVFYFCHFIIWSSIDNCVGRAYTGFKRRGGGKKLGVAKTLNI